VEVSKEDLLSQMDQKPAYSNSIKLIDESLTYIKNPFEYVGYD